MTKSKPKAYAAHELEYAPSNVSQEYEEAIQIKGQWHMPTRRLEHGKTILKWLKQHGLHTYLYRLSLCSTKEPISFVSVAARKSE